MRARPATRPHPSTRAHPYAASFDARAPDGAVCDPDAVRFLPSGPRLVEGAFCDDVFACASCPEEAAAIEAASPRFQCSPVPEGPCTGITCAYRDPFVLRND